MPKKRTKSAKKYKFSLEYTLKGKRKRKNFTAPYPDMGVYKVREYGAVIVDRYGKRSKVVKIPKTADPPYKLFKPGRKRASSIAY